MNIYLKLLFQFIIYFLYIVSVDYLFVYLLDITDNLLIYNHTVNAIIYFPLLIILLSVNKYRLNSFENNNKILLKPFIIGVVAIISFRIIEDPFFRMNNIFLKEEINIPDLSNAFNSKQLAGYFLGTVILAPIVEELFFRKYMIDKLTKKNNVIAVILPSLLFASIHIKFPNILLSFVMGLILSLTYLKYRDVRYTIIFHSGYNLLWLLLVIFNHQYWQLIKILNFNFIYWGIVTGSIVLLLFIVKFTITHNKK